MRIAALTIALWLSVRLPAAAARAGKVDESRLGYCFANVGGMAYYNAAIFLSDAMKESSGWNKAGWQGPVPAECLDSSGWLKTMPAGVSEVFTSFFTHSYNGSYPQGDYVVTWEGGTADGSDIDFSGAGVTKSSENLTSSPRRRAFLRSR